MAAQVMHYYADFWDLYGLNPLTIWDLPYSDFTQMTVYADHVRRERAKDGS